MPGRCCILNRENEMHGALAIVAAALGIDFVSGRALAAFYAQTGRASWLGIALSMVLFGLAVGAIAHTARRCGAQGMGELLSRLPGGGMGKGAHLLYGCVLLLAAGMLVTSAGRMGALTVPVRHADLLCGALALLAAAVIAFSGSRILKAVGGALALLMLALETALLLFADLPDTPRYEIELRLQGNYPAALIFAALHTAAGICLTAGLTVRFACGRCRPVRLGSFAGLFYGLLLGLGNAVLMAENVRILGLQLPFVALCADWGSTGFYLNAGLSWMFCVFSLAGLICGLLPSRNLSKNDVKL